MSEENQESKKSRVVSSSSNKLMIIGVFVLGIIIGGTFFLLQNTTTTNTVTQETPDIQEGMIASLITATEIDSKNALLWIQLGNAYYDTAQVKLAINAYAKALSIKPNMPEVLIDYGTMLRADFNYIEAEEAYNKALSFSKNNPLALYNKGLLLYYDSKDKTKAIESWQALIKNYPHARTPDGRLIKALLAEMEK